jgi:hypothetical protein
MLFKNSVLFNQLDAIKNSWQNLHTISVFCLYCFVVVVDQKLLRVSWANHKDRDRRRGLLDCLLAFD